MREIGREYSAPSGEGILHIVCMCSLLRRCLFRSLRSLTSAADGDRRAVFRLLQTFKSVAPLTRPRRRQKRSFWRCGFCVREGGTVHCTVPPSRTQKPPKTRHVWNRRFHTCLVFFFFFSFFLVFRSPEATDGSPVFACGKEVRPEGPVFGVGWKPKSPRIGQKRENRRFCPFRVRPKTAKKPYTERR